MTTDQKFLFYCMSVSVVLMQLGDIIGALNNPSVKECERLGGTMVKARGVSDSICIDAKRLLPKGVDK